MKKFKFSLETVLDYKDQVLNSLRNEHGILLAAIREQEEVLDGVWRRYREYNEEFCERKRSGMTATDAIMYQGALRAQELEIQRETEKLEKLQLEEEKKRSEVVEAKKETASLEKLREHKLENYHKELQKIEEQRIEEFVITQRVMTSA